MSLPGAFNFRCQEQLAGGLGARVDVANTQVVLLQGAEAEWFMFAYERDEGAELLGETTLNRTRQAIEEVLRRN